MKDLILNFLLRMMLGVLGIYVCNTLFSSVGVGVYLGLNLLNLLTVGILGISGFGLVLAMAAFSILWKTPKECCRKFCELFRLVSKKNNMLKSIQDKRLSGVSVRKPYHDRFGQVTHCFTEKCISKRLLRSKCFTMQYSKNLIHFSVWKNSFGLHKRRFLSKSEVWFGNKNTGNLRCRKTICL